MPEQNPKDDQNFQLKKMTAALKYVNGDPEKAKALLSGQLKDISLVKGLLSVEQSSVYAIFMIFFSKIDSNLKNVTATVVSDPSKLEKIYITDIWEQFYSALSRVAGESDINESKEIRKHLINCSSGYGLFSYVSDMDNSGVEDTLKDIFKKYYHVEDVECSVDIEELTSLEMEEIGLKIKDLHEEDASSGDTAQEKPAIESEADYIVEGALVIAPLRGKYIKDLSQGDLVRVQLVNKDPISMKLAETLKAITPEGQILPIKGRVRNVQPIEGGGFLIYCLVAKKVMAKIIEEENIKAELFSVGKDGSSELASINNRLYLYAGMMIGLVIIAIIIIYALVH